MARLDKPREKVLEVLRHVEDGEFADHLLDRSRAQFSALDNALIRELVYGVLRNRSLLDWFLNLYSERPVERTDARTRSILRLGAYQLLFLDRVPARAAIHTSAELAKTHGKKHPYVNGLLRNLDRNRNALRYPGPDDAVTRLSVRYSHPEWLVKRWVERFGKQAAEGVLAANNKPAPLTIRVNSLKTTRDDLKLVLKSQGADVRETRYSPFGLDIISSPGIRDLPAYQEGRFMVQDQSAQLVSMMLSPQPGETVLDACAAPGGKAAHCAEMMNNSGTVVALDIDPARMDKVKENSSRLGISILSPVVGDAAAYKTGAFEKILVDAPCSGLGLLRRHPDTRWHKKEYMLKERQAVQVRILENCAGMLKPGGVLVYSTCTTEPEENDDVVACFLSAFGNEFSIDDPRLYLPPAADPLVDSRGFLRTFPADPALDGFFGVRIVKKK